MAIHPRRDGIQEVSGSIPLISTNHRKVNALRCFLHLKKQYMHTEKTLNEKMIDLQPEIPYSYRKEGLPCPKMSMKS